MNKLNKNTPLDVSLAAQKLHHQAGAILSALVEIEEHREQVLRNIRSQTIRSNDAQLKVSYEALRVLNERRLMARNNYGTYILKATKLLS